LVAHLNEHNYRLLDCQLHNPHLESLGAREISREEYMAILVNA
ncbi:MAG TPA: leucyl/phenylalanyl-tRNA--protein transferase, partial [Flavobacterium sp.]|nr:leucyl/phenylalanyl-tRNA--protein transferase [Flavobacterium sp.]